MACHISQLSKFVYTFDFYILRMLSSVTVIQVRVGPTSERNTCDVSTVVAALELEGVRRHLYHVSHHICIPVTGRRRTERIEN
jgi:hypothetical protein